jgi:hypothetical protein
VSMPLKVTSSDPNRVSSDREGSDVSHPRGPRFVREERERIGGENETESMTGCEGKEVGMKTVSAQERIEGAKVSEKMRMQDGTRKKSVCLVSWKKWTMRRTTVHVWKVGWDGESWWWVGSGLS